MELNEKQEQGRILCKKWWDDKTNNKPFVILGIAGSGKTTLVNYIKESLKDINYDEISYVCFTGKASSVLTRKGNFATTIHKLIYNTKVDPNSLEVEFILKDEIEEKIKLIIIDEISMVNKELYNDLLSFGKRIIVLGDPFQLKPVSGDVCDIINYPDVFLDEPMRQSLDNPICFIANELRQKKYLKIGNYGDKVIVCSKDNINMDYFINSDQILTGKNNSVKKLNSFYRNKILNVNSLMPVEHEKLICLKNNWSIEASEGNISQPLINGLSVYCSNIKSLDARLNTFKMDLTPDYFNTNCYQNILSDGLYFTDDIKDDKELYNNYDKYKDIIYKRKLFTEMTLSKINKFTFGYATTVFKAQGSQWNSVFYIDEFMHKDTYWQHFYTAVTRAEDKLVIAK